MTESTAGELEIDHERGVIYFHAYTGQTMLRICRLPTPIPKVPYNDDGTWPDWGMLDITHMVGANWKEKQDD